MLGACGAPALIRQFKGRESLTILSLHRVSPDIDYFWQPLHPTNFSALCRYVQRHYKVLNLRDLDQPMSSKKPRLVFSFDDGYHDFIEYALPILHQHRLPANHNLVVNCLEHNMPIWTQRLNDSFGRAHDRGLELPVTVAGQLYRRQDFANDWMAFYLHVLKLLLTHPQPEREALLTQLEAAVDAVAEVRMMNWAEALTLADYDVEVGSHTYSHDSVPTITDPACLRHELVASRRVLAERLNAPITILGLPNGQNSSRLQPYIAEAGYTQVLETGNHGNASYRAPATGPACFRRINIVDEAPSVAQLRLEVLSLKQ